MFEQLEAKKEKAKKYSDLANRYFDAFYEGKNTLDLLIKEVLESIKDPFFMEVVALEFPNSGRYKLLNFTLIFLELSCPSYFSNNSDQIKFDAIVKNLYEALARVYILTEGK